MSLVPVKSVLLDTPVVRIVLGPATMRLLGWRNWWLDRVLADLSLEGSRKAQVERIAAPT